MNNSHLQDTLSTIASERERDGKLSQSFDFVKKLISDYGEENLAERLYAEIPLEYSWKVVADLFAILIWLMSDSGASTLLETTNKWLIEAEELRRIQIALNLDVYPFSSKTKMVEVLSMLSKRYPEVGARCNELIKSRTEAE